MRKIIPYKTQRNALAALDNGGRFYNIFTQSDDGEIASSELAKVAGVFTDKQKMFLYLEMSLSELDKNEASTIRSSMSKELKSAHRSHRPALYTPAQAVIQGRASKSAIITGVPQYMKSKSDFTGLIMIPVSTGNSMTFIMVPLIDHYDVYEVHDLEKNKKFIIAHARGAAKLTPRPTRFGGIFKKLQKDKCSKSKNMLYLEALYYSHVSSRNCCRGR